MFSVTAWSNVPVTHNKYATVALIDFLFPKINICTVGLCIVLVVCLEGCIYIFDDM